MTQTHDSTPAEEPSTGPAARIERLRETMLRAELADTRDKLEIAQYEVKKLEEDQRIADLLDRWNAMDADDAALVALAAQDIASVADLEMKVHELQEENADLQGRLHAAAGSARANVFRLDDYRVAENRFGRALLTTDQLYRIKPPAPVVDGVLFENTVGMLWGPSGLGKSFVALDLALCVAHGVPWHGRETKQGRVLYVAGEGVAGLPKRVMAWHKHHQLPETDSIDWLPVPVNLPDVVDVAEFMELLTEPGFEGYTLILLDTFARCTVGAGENDTKDMGLVMETLDRVKRVTKACVLSVHHAGKNLEQGLRGASAIKAALDTELSLLGDSKLMTLQVQKQKDAAEIEPMRFQLVPVPGTESVVPAEVDALMGAAAPAGAMETLRALAEIDIPGGVSMTTWSEACTHIERHQFSRHLAWLLKGDHIKNVGSNASPKYRPATTADDQAS